MSEAVYHIQSISELHRMLGIEPPQHPLISIIDVRKIQVKEELIGLRMSANLYSVSMKDGSCGMQYGRNYYDFEEGVMSFTAPNQVVSSTGTDPNLQGWMLFFHPDLIRGFHLGEQIQSYNFFSYDVHEALHLSQKEEGLINDMVERIQQEYSQNIDGHTQGLFASYLELLLNYCRRFYERQFHTRKKQNTDILSQVESLLQVYYQSEQQLKHGIPSIPYLAENVHLSPNYLSDLLKKETGFNAKEHINIFVIERAKNRLLSSNENISQVAYGLGFNYPHYFSRLFKQKTGMSPQKYRQAHA